MRCRGRDNLDVFPQTYTLLLPPIPHQGLGSGGNLKSRGDVCDAAERCSCAIHNELGLTLAGCNEMVRLGRHTGPENNSRGV